MTVESTSPSPSDEMNSAGKVRMATLVTDILQTRECRKALDALVSEFLVKWSGESKAKKTFMKPVGWLISKKLTKSSDILEEKELPKIFTNPLLIESLGGQLPEVVNGLIQILLNASLSFEALSQDEKKRFFDQTLSRIDSGKAGEIYTTLAKTAGSILQSDPYFFSERVMPLVKTCFAQTDFGEIKAYIDLSETDLKDMLRKTIDMLFEYPAKLVNLLGLLPGMGNILLYALTELFTRFANLPPDMIADIVLSLLREIKGESIGKLIHNINEFVRQLHTGSALIGEAGAPLFASDMGEKLRDIFNEIDPTLFVKAQNAIRDGREALGKSFIYAQADHPELLLSKLSQIDRSMNSNWLLLKEKLSAFGDLPENASSDALLKGLKGLNVRDLSEIINQASRMVNKVCEQEPGMLPSLLTEFINTLDLYEIEQTVSYLANDVGRAVKPLARITLPAIVDEFIGFFTIEDDGNDDRLNEAKKKLRQFLMDEETLS